MALPRERASAEDLMDVDLKLSSHSARVCYFYDNSIGSFYYGAGHPMKPHRVRLTHELILGYGLYKKMEVFRPHAADLDEMKAFHSDDYLEFLRRVSPDNAKELSLQLQTYNLGAYTDCPVFDGLYDYCRLSAGGSLDGAQRLIPGMADIAINWAGGLHHAKKSEASGFCYVNDIVLAILELLKAYPRVMYIDIDIHHGDGVEEAFYTTDRVMTVSFHKFGDYFPGTGALTDTGYGSGKGYAVNVPLTDGMDDRSFVSLFKPIVTKAVEVYRPGAIVMQCGADSLTGDRLGTFNLTTKGHGECVRHVRGFNVPLLVVGGGGYVPRNVSRAWCYETALLLDTSIPVAIPYTEYLYAFGPEFKLHLTPAAVQNLNTRDSLERTRISVMQNLAALPPVPSVQIQAVPPELSCGLEAQDAVLDAADPDQRMPTALADRLTQHEADFFADDRDQDEHNGAQQPQTASQHAPHSNTAVVSVSSSAVVEDSHMTATV